MDLIFIYGPPACGKFTVANELCQLTGYKNFHNHLTYDIARTFYEWWENEKFIEMLRFLRLSVFEKLLEQEYKGIVFTYCYDSQWDNPFVEKVLKLFEQYNWSVKFVNLYCDMNTLKQRVIWKSRKKYNKIQDIKTLEEYFQWWNPYDKIDYVENLSIDNTDLKPIDVVEEIMSSYKL